ncbi:MAG: hypothetical protein PHC64_06815 [Candidatus Gastranaerophilales bacterium]|nr:hypothetical protein [Candidatus Gastranaerophilales bacterium]
MEVSKINYRPRYQSPSFNGTFKLYPKEALKFARGRLFKFFSGRIKGDGSIVLTCPSHKDDEAVKILRGNGLHFKFIPGAKPDYKGVMAEGGYNAGEAIKIVNARLDRLLDSLEYYA